MSRLRLIDKLLHRRTARKVNNLVWLTIGVLVITVIILTIALSLYKTSGAAQLDLSRPEYNGIRQQAKVKEDDEFDTKGPVDRNTIKEFLKSYDARAEKINAINAFGPEPLSDQALGLSQ